MCLLTLKSRRFAVGIFSQKPLSETCHYVSASENSYRNHKCTAAKAKVKKRIWLQVLFVTANMRSDNFAEVSQGPTLENVLDRYPDLKQDTATRTESAVVAQNSSKQQTGKQDASVVKSKDGISVGDVVAGFVCLNCCKMAMGLSNFSKNGRCCTSQRIQRCWLRVVKIRHNWQSTCFEMSPSPPAEGSAIKLDMSDTGYKVGDIYWGVTCRGCGMKTAKSSTFSSHSCPKKKKNVERVFLKVLVASGK